MPTSMDMSSIVNPAIEAGQSGANQAMKMSDNINSMLSTMSDLKSKQQQQEQMQQQLNDATYKGTMGTANTAMGMSDSMFKAAEPAMEKRMKQYNPDYQPGSLKAMRSDEDAKAAFQVYHQAVLTGQMPTDPDQQKMLVNAVGDPEKMAELVPIFQAQRAKEAAMAVAKLKGIVAERGQDLGLQGKQVMADAMKQRYSANGPAMVRAQTGAANSYNAVMKPWESTLQSADQLSQILGDVDAGKLNAAKNVRGDISAKMASLINAGKATVYGTQSTELNSAYGHLQDTFNHVFGEANGTITQAQLNQLHQELISFKDTAQKNHDDAYQSFRESVNPMVRQGLDNRFNKFRSAKELSGRDYSQEYQELGLPASQPSTAPQVPAAGHGSTGTPQTSQVPTMPADIQAKIQAAKKAGYSDVEIQAYVKKLQGGK